MSTKDIFFLYVHEINCVYNFSISVGHQREETIGEASPSSGTIGGRGIGRKILETK